jgi:hypothetical protein
MPPVASNLQITTNYGPAVNARGKDQLMAEQENVGKMLGGLCGRGRPASYFDLKNARGDP